MLSTSSLACLAVLLVAVPGTASPGRQRSCFARGAIHAASCRPSHHPTGRRPHAVGPIASLSEGRDPPRVDANSQISVRTQIKLARYFKQLQQDDLTKRHTVRTRFRKAKSESTRRLDDDNSAQRKDAPTVLLVDGYNIIGAWRQLTKLRDEGQMASARDVLTARLCDYAYYMDWRCEIVFDGAGNEERAGDAISSVGHGVDVVFSAEAADTYIDTQTRALLESDAAGSVFVASGDWAVQQSSEAHNAHVISARQLVNQITGLHTAISKQVVTTQVEAAAHFGAFSDHLNAKSRDALVEIERKLRASKPAKPIKARVSHVCAEQQQLQRQQQLERQQKAMAQVRQELQLSPLSSLTPPQPPPPSGRRKRGAAPPYWWLGPFPQPRLLGLRVAVLLSIGRTRSRRARRSIPHA
jgi:predicted RNA-binding protein with PIN domain